VRLISQHFWKEVVTSSCKVKVPKFMERRWSLVVMLISQHLWKEAVAFRCEVKISKFMEGGGGVSL
jgi:hypothetical protein